MRMTITALTTACHSDKHSRKRDDVWCFNENWKLVLIKLNFAVKNVFSDDFQACEPYYIPHGTKRVKRQRFTKMRAVSIMMPGGGPNPHWQ
jgi:hypothetical protein